MNRIIMEPTAVSAIFEKDIDGSQIRIGKKVSDAARLRLLELLKRKKHCFASSLRELGHTNSTEMNIELNTDRPVVYRPYRLSHH